MNFLQRLQPLWQDVQRRYLYSTQRPAVQQMILRMQQRLRVQWLRMYGMSDTFGMMCLATVENQYLDGRAGLICGEDTAGQIDKEVLSIINKSYEDAMQMLTENRDILDHISDYLYEKETITGKEFMKIFREMKGLPQEEDKESLMPDDTADEKKASQEPRVLSKENNEAKDDTSIAEDSQSKAAIVSDDMFEE